MNKINPILPDRDQAGLPDDWERTHELDPSDASDASMVTADGYTALEHDCHHLAALRTETAANPTLENSP